MHLFGHSGKVYKATDYTVMITNTFVLMVQKLGGGVDSTFVFPVATTAYFNCHRQRLTTRMCTLSGKYPSGAAPYTGSAVTTSLVPRPIW